MTKLQIDIYAKLFQKPTAREKLFVSIAIQSDCYSKRLAILGDQDSINKPNREWVAEMLFADTVLAGIIDIGGEQSVVVNNDKIVLLLETMNKIIKRN